MCDIDDLKAVPACFRAALLNPESIRSIATQLVTVPVFKETIVGAILPHICIYIARMRAKMVETTPETLSMDATLLRIEMKTFINDALHDFQAQTVVDSRNNFQDALEDLRQTLETPSSTSV